MKSAVERAGRMGADPERQLKKFISKFEPRSQALINSVRTILKRRFPTANELVYDNYNFFVIGYSPTERPSDTIISVAAAANGVGLSFYRGSTLPDPHHILLGSGKQNRFIRIAAAETLGRPEVQALIAAAVSQAKAPLSSSGCGKLIVRSISAKQRPRKRPEKTPKRTHRRNVSAHRTQL